jgi:hypothetical protein
VRRYSRARLRRLLTGAGFAVTRLTYTNAVLFAPILVARAMQRARGLSSEENATRDIAVPPAPVNAILTSALWMESKWLRAFDNAFGSSLLCLARKPA